ncbi:MAG TPA: hypothetical protein VG370_14920 [Chloroflexota bacterium]|nr:hypothetical protein [Chloroflexota bacterium]
MREETRQDHPQPSTLNPQPDVGEIIRIVDDQIDVDAIMAEIRANLAGRLPLEPDPSGLSYTPAAGAESELEWAIEEAAESARDLQIGDQLQPGVGLFGRLTARAKRPLHQLARFYVELLATRQSAVNRPLVRALELLAKRVAEQEREIAELKRQLAEPGGGAPSASGSGYPAPGEGTTS